MKRGRMRILIVDEIRIRREGMASLLREANGVDEVVTAATHHAATALEDGVRPDVVLMDASAPGAAPTLRTLLETAPGVRVVATGVADHDDEIVDCLESGYAGYLCRDAGVDDLSAVLHAAARDETVCCPRVATALRRRVQALRGERRADGATGPAGARLTRRERDVGALLEEGLSNKEIARRLSITVLTVKNHVHNILEKLQARRRGEAAARLRTLRDGRAE
jgi:two-component system nitrate/nitrite response regulator NarL